MHHAEVLPKLQLIEHLLRSDIACMAGAGRAYWGMVLTKIVSLCFLTSAVVIFFNVLTGRHQELADEVSSVLHQSFTRSTYEVHDPKVLEVRHEVRCSSAPLCLPLE